MSRRKNFLFTSESVTEGHPDKIADQISDAVLDAIMAEDPTGRVACETLVTTGLAFVAGEITTRTYVDIPDIVRTTIKDIGYDRAKYGFDCYTCAVINAIDKQSPDIAQGVDTGGAGDQGLMFGYACNDTRGLMPAPIALAHRLVRRMTDVRKQGLVDYLRPDGKSQVSIEYRDGKPHRVEAIVLACQHSDDVSIQKLRSDLTELVINHEIPKHMIDEKTKYHINATGKFVIGGPQGDAGVTGRKIIVDTYGGWAPHGGGAFSGKDPTKVDRSATYMARYIAKNLVAAGVSNEITVQLAYAIGVAEPVSVLVDTHNSDTNGLDITAIEKAVREIFPLTPRGIIDHLRLRRPIYRQTAAYGHFGRSENGFTWEETDKVSDIRTALKI
ncbi:MAG TPA: methionine adenosyltransferase [bacterium]|nr:methionine adenosyltransferase [bacterium]